MLHFIQSYFFKGVATLSFLAVIAYLHVYGIALPERFRQEVPFAYASGHLQLFHEGHWISACFYDVQYTQPDLAPDTPLPITIRKAYAGLSLPNLIRGHTLPDALSLIGVTVNMASFPGGASSPPWNLAKAIESLKKIHPLKKVGIQELVIHMQQTTWIQEKVELQIENRPDAWKARFITTGDIDLTGYIQQASPHKLLCTWEKIKWNREAPLTTSSPADAQAAPQTEKPAFVCSASLKAHIEVEQLDTAPLALKGTFESNSPGCLNVMGLYEKEIPFDKISGSFTGAWLSNLHVEVDLTSPGPQAHFNISLMHQLASAASPDKDLICQAHGDLHNLHSDAFSTYWPPNLGSETRQWAVSHLKEGNVSEAHVDLTLHTGEHGSQLEQLSGGLTIEGMTVHYLDPMPPVLKTQAQATFGKDFFDITVTGGQLGHLLVTGGLLHFYALDQARGLADIKLSLKGPLDQAIAVVDHEPLRYPSTWGVTAKDIQGDALLQLSLKFPLQTDLTPKNVKIHTEAKIRNFQLLKSLPALHSLGSLKGKEMTFSVNNQGLFIKGTGTLNQLPLSWEWKEVFPGQIKKEGASRDINFSTQLTQEYMEKLGFSGLKTGVVPLTCQIRSDAQGTKNITLLADISGAELNFLEGAHHKPAHQLAHVTASWQQRDGDQPRHINFSYEDPALSAAGTAELGTSLTDVQQVRLTHLASGKTNIQAHWQAAQNATGWTLSVRGKTLDLEPLIASWRKKKDQQNNWNGHITLDVDEIYVSLDQFIPGMRGTLSHQGGQWEAISLQSYRNQTKNAGEDSGKPPPSPDTQIQLIRRPEESYLHIHSDDAGALLAIAIDSGRVKKGRLSLDLKTDKDSHWKGGLHIRGAQILNMPVLAKILSLISPMAVVDLVTGKGMAFNTITAEIELGGQVLKIKEGRATNAGLGLTFEGYYDQQKEYLHMYGDVIPAYLINGLLSKIPLIGPWLAGGKDKGIFAAHYQVKGNLKGDIKVDVNPLSLLTPGFTRKIFDEKPPEKPTEPLREQNPGKQTHKKTE